ncbi:hypothetical protein OFN34_26890, partial [Escherichia coli]|nr:hypothetical protein [Escherichia coli]
RSQFINKLMHFPIKTLSCALLAVIGLFFQTGYVFANTDKHIYLEEHISPESQPMLSTYFRSMGKPRSIKENVLTVPQDASPETLALYYFARIYLERYEGVPLPDDMPD